MLPRQEVDPFPYCWTPPWLMLADLPTCTPQTSWTWCCRWCPPPSRPPCLRAPPPTRCSAGAPRWPPPCCSPRWAGGRAGGAQVARRRCGRAAGAGGACRRPQAGAACGPARPPSQHSSSTTPAPSPPFSHATTLTFTPGAGGGAGGHQPDLAAVVALAAGRAQEPGRAQQAALRRPVAHPGAGRGDHGAAAPLWPQLRRRRRRRRRRAAGRRRGAHGARASGRPRRRAGRAGAALRQQARPRAGPGGCWPVC